MVYNVLLPPGTLAITRLAEARANQKVQSLLSKYKADEDKVRRELLAEELRASHRNADGSYNAFMCRSCRFGPVAHMVCVVCRVSCAYCVSVSVAVVVSVSFRDAVSLMCA